MRKPVGLEIQERFTLYNWSEGGFKVSYYPLKEGENLYIGCREFEVEHILGLVSNFLKYDIEGIEALDVLDDQTEKMIVTKDKIYRVKAPFYFHEYEKRLIVSEEVEEVKIATAYKIIQEFDETDARELMWFLCKYMEIEID